MKKIILLLILTAVSAQSAGAAAPNLLTYQGRLKESGLAVTGNRAVEIFLCDAETAGTCVTSDPQPVAVVNGLFRSTFTVPGTVDLAAGGWWLEIKVAGVTLTPRERLTSTTFALYAATASFVADGSITDAKLASGISASKLTGQLTNTSTVTITGSDGRYGLLVSSGISLAGLVYTNNGGVGLGTVSPEARLDVLSAGTAPDIYAQIWRNGGGTVVASMTSQGTLFATLPAGSGDSLGTHNATQNLNMGGFSVDSAAQLTVSTITGPGSAYIFVNQNLALPSSLLAIGKGVSSSAFPLAVYGDSAGIAPVLHLENKTNGPGSGIGVLFSANGASLGSLQVVDESATGGGTSMRLGTTAGEVLRLHGARVGIGNTSPDQELTVTGDISQTGVLISSGTGNNYFAGKVGIGQPAPAYALDVNYTIRAYAPSGSNGMIILGDGDIAHGITGVAPTTDTFGLITAESPTGGLHLQGFSSAVGTVGTFLGGVIGSADPTDSVAAVQLEGGKKNGAAEQAMGALETVFGVRNFGGSNQLALLGNGNFGVGVVNPGYKLDVQGGYVNASGGLCINGNCKSDWASVGDGLGSHIATTDLNLAQYSLVSVASVTMVGKGLQIGTGLTAGASGVLISTSGQILTLGLGNGTAPPNPRGIGAVDLQTRRLNSVYVAAGDYSFIGGGENNQTGTSYAVIGGGGLNDNSGTHAFIGAGYQNSINIGYAAIAGGMGNTITSGASYSFIGGGSYNLTNGNYSSVSGGESNNTSNSHATVAGGRFNHVAGQYGTVPGGYYNTADGNYSFAAGAMSSSTAQGAFTWNDSGGATVRLLNAVTDRTLFKNRGGFIVTGSTDTSLSGLVNRGMIVTGDGLVGVSTGTPGAALDVVSTGTAVTDYAQIWRNSQGTVVASMTATGRLYAQVASPAAVTLGPVVTTVLSEQTLLSYTLPANTLSYNGKGIKITAWGTTAANANVKTLRLKFGNSVMAFNDASTSPSALNWELVAEVFRTGVGTQTSSGKGQVGSAVQSVVQAAPSENEAGGINITFTGEAPGATGDITVKGLMVETLN